MAGATLIRFRPFGRAYFADPPGGIAHDISGPPLAFVRISETAAYFVVPFLITVLFFAGAEEGAMIPVSINDLFWRTEITLTSSYAGAPYDCQTALDLIRAGGVPVERTITHRLNLEEGPKGFEAVSAPTEHNCVKVIIEPNR
jgi:L-iditol 2-dehydrogenase